MKLNSFYNRLLRARRRSGAAGQAPGVQRAVMLDR